MGMLKRPYDQRLSSTTSLKTTKYQKYKPKPSANTTTDTVPCLKVTSPLLAQIPTCVLIFTNSVTYFFSFHFHFCLLLWHL